jgi:hypothetical protein
MLVKTDSIRTDSPAGKPAAEHSLTLKVGALSLKQFFSPKRQTISPSGSADWALNSDGFLQDRKKGSGTRPNV